MKFIYIYIYHIRLLRINSRHTYSYNAFKRLCTQCALSFCVLETVYSPYITGLLLWYRETYEFAITSEEILTNVG